MLKILELFAGYGSQALALILMRFKMIEELNRIINDDCLNVMKQIESGSIDLVVTDPPYLIKNTKAGGKSEFAKSRIYIFFATRRK